MTVATSVMDRVEIQPVDRSFLTRGKVLSELKKSRNKYQRGEYKTEKEMWALEGSLRELVKYK